MGIATVDADENGIIPTWAIRKQEHHDRWQNPLVLAYQFKALVDDGMTRTQVAELAGVSRPRVTQVMNLLNLHPRIQEYLADAENNPDSELFTERKLREVAGMDDRTQQLRAFRELIQGHEQNSGALSKRGNIDG